MRNMLFMADLKALWDKNTYIPCCLCNNGVELRNYLFFQWEFSAEIWSNLTKGLLGHHYTYDCMNTVHELAKNDLDCQRLFLIRYAFQITIPSIWMERNRLNHGDPPSRPLSLHKTVDNDIQNRLSLSVKYW